MNHLVSYDKEWTSIEQQIDQLESRGLLITDRTSFAHSLEAIGYYRLTGYTFPFRRRVDGEIADGVQEATSQDQIIALYDFDRRFKLKIMDAI